MAPSLGSRRLTCFYCGRRSPIRRTGTVREWECENCEAVNYLDENGEITDPPVATVEEVSSTVQYARISQSSSSSPPPSSADNSLFCNDCLKNQHLFRSSLAQYVPEEKDTMGVDRDYLKFKESLEKRYPQVCEDCLPGIVGRLKQSSYTAKTDHLRRLLDKTRRIGVSAKSRRTWLDDFHLLGQLLWNLGVYGQVLLHLAGVFSSLLQRLLNIWTSKLSSPEPLIEYKSSDVALSYLASWARDIIDFLDNNETPIWSPSYYGVTAHNMAKWSLLLSLASTWWNPKFKEGFRGYHRHIKGFYDWYKYQSLFLIAKVLFWFMIQHGIFDRVDPSATLGIHIFMLGFTISVSSAARKCFTVDFGRLFAPTSPERLLPYVGRKDTSKYNGHDMSQALTSILEDSSSTPAISSSTNAVDPFYEDDKFGVSLQPPTPSRYELPSKHPSEHAGSIRRSLSRDPRDVLGIPRTTPSLTEMTPDESLRYLSTGEVPARMHADIEHDGTQDIMEWKPQGSQYRAFQPARAPRQSQLFNQAPVVPDQSPFWYKGLPPAPISQAHKVRNPPNAPRLLAPSQEAKKNFFDRITGKQISPVLSETSPGMLEIEYPSVAPCHEIEFAQPKFFPPTAPDAATGLSEMFEQSFTLKPTKSEDKRTTRTSPQPLQRERRERIFTALALLVAFLSWNFFLAHPERDVMRAPLGVMIACGLIALRSVADCAISWLNSNNSFLNVSIAILAGAQTVASGYGISEIMAGRACRLQGSSLVGVMLVQEVCFMALPWRKERTE